MSTLQAWATPTEALPQYADHTFVYCTDNQSIFGCWAGGSITDPDAFCVEGASYPNAYAVANCYRCPVGKAPDTAGVGIYGVNGVCHQSANLFMYSVTAAPMHLFKDPTGTWRPQGLLASYALYGPHGTITPGDVGAQPVYFLGWLAVRYRPCKKAAGQEDTGPTPQDALAQALHDLYTSPGMAQANPNDVLVQELALVAEAAVPGLNAQSFADLHRDLLTQKEALLSSEWDSSQPFLGAPLAEKINDLVEQFQQGLLQRLGAPQYAQLMGLTPGETIRIVDPRIASGELTP